jgi:hypothetical protein
MGDLEEIKRMLVQLVASNEVLLEESRVLKEKNGEVIARLNALESREPMMVKTEEGKESAEGAVHPEPSLIKL